MRPASLVLILPLLLAPGGANTPAHRGLARKVVPKEWGGGVRTVGTCNPKDKAEPAAFSAADREKAGVPLDRGALGFIVLGPDYRATSRPAVGRIADFVDVARIGFLRGGRIAGDCAAAK